jgi:hypothetical protein
MRNHLKTLATCVLVSALATAHRGSAQAAPTAAPTQKQAHKAVRRKPVRKPTVEDQIQQLRQEMEQQIQALQQQIQEKNSQLQQAQQAAAAAQAGAQQAQTQAQQQASESAAQLANLQGAVADLKTSSSSVSAMVQGTQKQTAALRKEFEEPDAVHYKGVLLTPDGSFLAAETVWRQRATGGGLNTPFTGIPFNNSDQGQYSEFYGTGRQSRVALMALGGTDWLHMRGYYEADFLNAGATSNNNQSNSYPLRQRQLWGEATLNNGLTFVGGQMWSLATEDQHGMENRTEILPQTIDPQYAVGFVWARQYAVRLYKNFNNKVWLGASAENSQIPGIVGHGTPNNEILGSAGVGGGLFNPLANYSSNYAPDLIAKMSFEPGWGHYELFGVARFFRNRVYPGEIVTTSSTGTTKVSGTAAGAYNDKTVGGGIGASMRVPAYHNLLSFGLKGLYGDGTARYASSQVGDLTLRPNGQMALVHNYSALGTLEYNGKKLGVYVNYGIDGDLRRYFDTNAAGTKQEGYGAYTANNAGCFTEPLPGSGGYAPGSQSNCNADTRDVQEAVVGYWYKLYNGEHGSLRQGIQYSYFQRQTWSGAKGLSPVGTDNAFWTSFRYYLPTTQTRMKPQ